MFWPLLFSAYITVANEKLRIDELIASLEATEAAKWYILMLQPCVLHFDTELRVSLDCITVAAQHHVRGLGMAQSVRALEAQ